MRTRLASSLLLLALAACQAGPGPVRPAATATREPSPAALASAAAPATGSPRPGAAPLARLLSPPKGEFHTLAGKIQLDPQVLAAKGGSLLSNNGGAIAAAVGGAVLANNGSSLLSDNGGAIVANNSGNIIADDGSGGQAAAAPGGALLAAGGGLLSDHGTGLTGKTKYALQQAQDRPPTAGMLISAVSLKTHKYVPVGVDAEGKPAYAVYSNLKGEYQLFLPKSEEGNVLVVASAPVVRDDSLVINAFTPVAATDEVALDEDTALATAHLRRLFVARIASMLTGNFGDDLLANLGKRNEFLAPILDRLARVVKKIADDGHVPQGPGADLSPQVQEMCTVMTDVALAYIDPTTMHTSKLYTPDWPGPDESVYGALGDTFRRIRASTEQYMAARPGEHLKFQQDRRNGKEAAQPACLFDVDLPLENASSVGSFIQTQVLPGDYSHPLTNTIYALRALSLVPVPGEKPFSPDDRATYALPTGEQVLLSDRLDACQIAVMSAILLTLSPPDWNGEAPYPPATQALVDLAAAYTSSHTFQAAAPASPRPSCVPAP
jgi:hypothetical protein